MTVDISARAGQALESTYGDEATRLVADPGSSRDVAVDKCQWGTRYKDARDVKKARGRRDQIDMRRNACGERWPAAFEVRMVNGRRREGRSVGRRGSDGSRAPSNHVVTYSAVSAEEQSLVRSARARNACRNVKRPTQGARLDPALTADG